MIHNFYHQTDLPLEIQILNISVNLARMGNWTFELYNLLDQKGESIYKSRLNLINKLKQQTEAYIDDLDPQDIAPNFKPTLDKFKYKFDVLKKENITRENYKYWAEEAFTWANILQHRAKLA